LLPPDLNAPNLISRASSFGLELFPFNLGFQ